MKTPAGVRRIAGAVLLAWMATMSPVSTGAGNAIDIGIPGRANANASIASRGSLVGITWAARTQDGVTDIYMVTSRDAGRTFTAPVRVNRVVGGASAAGEQPPRIVVKAGGATTPEIVVIWTAKGGSGTRLVSARSTDGGNSFGPAASLPGSDAGGNRGWESVAVTAKGEVVAVWLDHRAVPARTPGAMPADGHQHGAAPQRSPAEGVARAQLSQIFFARLGEPATAHAIAPGVCYCCKTSIATGTGGTVVAAWRHVYPGNIRDIALATSSDGGRTFAPPVRVSEDDWVLDGCPENGPAVAVDQSNATHVVWPTLVRGAAGTDETLALFYAMSKDGQRFTTRQQLPTEGVPRHAQVALASGGTVMAAWDEQVKGGRRIVVATGTRDGKSPARFVRQWVSDEPGTYPVIAPMQDGATMVAWTSGSTGDTVLRVARRPR